MQSGLEQSAFWLSQLTTIAGIVVIAYLSGLLSTRRGVRVNYTRKIVHFTLFFLPLFLTDVFVFEPTLWTSVTSGLIFATFLALLTRPVRSRIGFVATIFASFDRPEDRPHTLFWLTSQILVGYAILVPLAVVFNSLGMYGLIYIPILINGIGDGLAEPVGVRFGKRSYEVGALFSNRTYERTLEGSACVFVTGIVVVAALHGLFTTPQFIAALLIIPPAMTLAEARAPHTWDTPFLFLVGGLILLAIVTFL